MQLQKFNSPRVVKHLTDENGDRVVHVPVDDEGEHHAIVDEVVFEDLIDLGCNPIWRIKKDRGRDRVVRWNPGTRQDMPIARLITDAKPGESIAHVNGNPLDLRGRNLVTGPGKGTRNDRDDIRPSQKITYKSFVKHEYK